MNTILEQFDGVSLIRPVGNFQWPHSTFSGFPECCGIGVAGELGNKAIPENILGLNVSPACCIHDWMFEHGPRTWQGFHYANSVLLCNLLQINESKGENWFMRKIRTPLILSGYIAVSTPIVASYYFSLGARI